MPVINGIFTSDDDTAPPASGVAPPPAPPESGTRMLSASEFAKQIKAKYPEYKDWDDHQLARAMVEKFPQYSRPAPDRNWAVEPMSDPNQKGDGSIKPTEKSFFSKAYDVVRNSAIGHAVESSTPALADKLNFHPSDTVYNPDYQAHRDQLLAPEELIDQNQPDTKMGALKSGVRGGLKAVGGLTTGESMAMIVGSAVGAEAIPALGGAAALNRLGRVFPGLASIVAKKGAGYIFSRMISGGFTADMVTNLIKQSPELGKAIGEGRNNDAAELLGSMLTQGYMATKAGEHAAGVEPAPAGMGDLVRFKDEKGRPVTGKVVDQNQEHVIIETKNGDQIPMDPAHVKVTKRAPAPDKPRTKVSLADEGELEKLGYTSKMMDRLNPQEVDSILKNKTSPGDFKFRPAEQPPKAAAAAAGAPKVTEPPPAPPAQGPGETAVPMELSHEQLAAAGQMTDGMRQELDNMAYQQGYGSADDLLAAVREKASRGEDLTEDDKRAMQISEGDLTTRSSAKAELDKRAYEAGYGSTGDYIKDVLKRKKELAADKEAYEAGFGDPEQMERYRQSQQQGEILMRIAHGDDATAMKEHGIEPSEVEPETQTPVGQPASAEGETPAEPSQDDSKTRANEPGSAETPPSPPNTPKPGVSPEEVDHTEVIGTAKKAIGDAGMVDKGHMAFGKNITFQVEHPEYPGYTTTITPKDLAGLSEDAAAKMVRNKMRAKLIEFGKPVPEDLKTSQDKKEAPREYTPGESIKGVYGRPTVIHTPNGDHDAYYRVVEVEDLKPSHHPVSFMPNQNYPKGVQERQYHSNKNAQNEVDKYAQEKKWPLYVNNDPTSVNGPSQSLPDGTVLGGNGRTMGLARAYASGDTSYKQYLVEHAHEFGIDPKAVEAMNHPALDRVIVNANHQIDSLRRLGADLNKNFTKKTSTVEAAVSAGKNLSSVSAEKIGQAISQLGDEGSIRNIMSDDPQMFRDMLLQDGIVREGDLPQYFDSDGSLNDTGKDFVENMLLGSVVRDPALLENMPAHIKGKLIRNLSPLLELNQRTDTWNILDDLRSAIDIHRTAQASGRKVLDLIHQAAFDEDGNPVPPPTDRVADLAMTLAKKPTQVTTAFRQFAADAREDVQGQDAMFGKPDPEESFDRAFNPKADAAKPSSQVMDSAATVKGKRGAVKPPPPPPSGAGSYTPLETTPMQGPLGELHTQTIQPAVRDAVRTVVDSAKMIRDTFAPGGQLKGTGDVSGTDITKLSIRSREAERAFALNQIDQMFEPIRNFFQKFNREERTENLSMIDAGRAKELAQRLGMPELATYVNVLKQTREQMFQKAMAMKGVPAQLMNPNYWLAHLYVAEDGTPLSDLVGRRPLEGPRSFFKKRSFPTMADFQQYAKETYGVNVKPMFDNPVDFERAKIAEMLKYQAGHTILEDLHAASLPKFVHALSGEVPDGYAIPQDKSFSTVYAPPYYTVSEAYDQLMYDRLNDVMDAMGIQHTRKVNIGGDGRWGFAEMGGRNAITTKVGGELRVITHEIGHILDDQYGLAKKWVNDPFVKNELRALADLRYEGSDPSKSFKGYVREGSEKIANLVDAYVHNREQAEQVAPHAVRYLESLIDDNPELDALRKVKPSQVLGANSYKVSTDTVNILGQWAFPKEVTRILDNHLSTGLRSNPMFRSYQFAGNMLNQVQLGWSAFHMLFTANDAAVSKASLGLQQILDGEYLKGATNIVKGNIITAPIEYFLKGNRYLKTMPKFGEAFNDETNTLIKGGGRVKMEDFYHNSAVQSFWDAWHGGNKLGAVGRWGVPALVEEVAKPIMEDWVPRMKLGAYLDLAGYELSKLPENASVYDQKAVAARAWDSIDNRLGQVVYDNFFWNRTLKDVMLASVRSLGWNVGTFREFGGGAIDLTKGIKRAVTGEASARDIITPRLAYTIALPIVMGIQGAVLQYMMTGNGPDELKDYYFPKTGKLNPDGTPERISTPSYIKDFYHYGGGFKRGIGSGLAQAGQTLQGKVHPLIAMVGEMLENKDFFGVEIRNPDDPAVQQLKEITEYVGKQFVPFSVRNAEKRLESVDKHGPSAIASKESIESLFGILPASKSLDRTDSEEMAAEYVSDQLPRGARANSEFERTKLRNEIAQELRLKDPEAFTQMKEAIESGDLSQRDMHVIRSKVRYSWLQSMVQRLNLRKAFRVYDAGTPEEQEQLKPVLLKKRAELFSLPAEQREEYIKRLKEVAGDNDSSSAPPAPPSSLSSPMSSTPGDR